MLCTYGNLQKRFVDYALKNSTRRFIIQIKTVQKCYFEVQLRILARYEAKIA